MVWSAISSTGCHPGNEGVTYKLAARTPKGNVYSDETGNNLKIMRGSSWFNPGREQVYFFKVNGSHGSLCEINCADLELLRYYDDKGMFRNGILYDDPSNIVDATILREKQKTGQNSWQEFYRQYVQRYAQN